ncbi:unnamed protein product [Owenia fusiformis]|uniref:Uncharacterized protein n=1 Tax=Owenia fusiformis TaxID=6347 RepID=A0A8J1TRD1_OWEFU|nr:unnamed protein product [Owenia fusiformis]
MLSNVGGRIGRWLNIPVSAVKVSSRLQSTLTDNAPIINLNRPIIGQMENLMDIGSRSIFSEEHDMFRETARKFFREKLQPHHFKWEQDGIVPREIWKLLGEHGFLGITSPEKYGGIGADFLSTVVLWEEQWYAHCTSPDCSLSSDLVLPYIWSYGTEEQKVNYIPKFLSGDIIGSIAMSEPAAGSDLQGIRTNVVKDGDDWVMNGSKVFITNGIAADLVIVVALMDKSVKPAKGMGLFLVEADTPGFTKGKNLSKIGLNGQDTAELFFDNVRLPKSALLGEEENKGWQMLMEQLPVERLKVAVMGQAYSMWMFEETRKYVRERKAFGKTLANLQTIQHKLAEMKTELCIGQAYVDQCILMHLKMAASGGIDHHQASMAKLWITELQNRVATQCLQLHGGWGYMKEYPISRAFCDSRVTTIYAGSNEIMREIIAKDIVA